MLASLLRGKAVVAAVEPPFPIAPELFVVLMLAGLLVGIAGHVVKSKATVAVGIGMVFLATILLPFATNVLKS